MQLQHALALSPKEVILIRCRYKEDGQTLRQSSSGYKLLGKIFGAEAPPLVAKNISPTTDKRDYQPRADWQG
jgi:hypothetical protein